MVEVGAKRGQASCVGGAGYMVAGGYAGGRSVRVEMNPTRYGASDLSSG